MTKRFALIAVLFFLAGRTVFAGPKLILVIVVDQMRADYFDHFEKEFKGGFKRLRADGAYFPNAKLSHVPAETAVGHAAILTGRSPSQNGIIGNDWQDRKHKLKILAAEDPKRGAGPINMTIDTIGDFQKTKNPKSRVVAVSIKDRSAVFLGGKKGDGVFWFNKLRNQFVTSKYYGAPPAWLADFNASYRAPMLVRIDSQVLSQNADEWVIALAKKALAEYELGKDEDTDILAVSLSATDLIGHERGPFSPELRDHLIKLDGLMEEFLSWVQNAVGADEVDVVLTADHGALPVPESDAGLALKATRVGERKFLYLMERELQAAHPGGARKWVTFLSLPHLYLNRDLAQSLKTDWPAFLKSAAGIISSLDNVAAVYIPGQWDASDPYADVYQRSFYPDRSGDLLIRMKENVLLTDRKKGTSHGAPYDYDSRIPLIFYGPDFKAGVYTEAADMRDIAPTLADILRLTFQPERGNRVLREALKASQN